jgi:hypothetical protein
MTSTYTLTKEITIVLEDCIECGTQFGMSSTLHAFVKSQKKAFYCPNGHRMSYTSSEADRLRKELADEKEKLRLKTQEAQNIAKGYCPRCHVEFKNINSHMKKMHPLY